MLSIFKELMALIIVMEKTKSLSLNSIFYLIYNVLNVIFPFITGIYVAHILLSFDIGRIEAAKNVASYFVILSFLGIPTYGLREVAKARKEQGNLNKLYSELMVINSISTTIFSLIYFGLIFIVPEYRGDITIYLLAGISIVLNFLNNSWLFEGLEKFGFVSLRNLIFKVLSFAALVIFVRNENDFLIYLIITVVGTAGNYLFNIISTPRFVKFSLKGLELRRHLKPILFLSLVNLAIEIYSLVDITMLTFMCTKEVVAYYSYGMKIFRVLLQIVNTFTMVLVPRIALYHKEGRTEEFNAVVSKTFLVIALVAVPIVIGIWFTADYLVPAIYGDEYIRSSMVIKILCFILTISPFGYLLGSRMLLISGQENKMIIPVGAGALTNLTANFILIPQLSEVGAAIASVTGEVVVMSIYLILGRKQYRLVDIFGTLWKEAVAILVMTGFLIGISFIPTKQLVITIIQICGAIIIYGALLLILRERVSLDFTKKVLGRFKKHG